MTCMIAVNQMKRECLTQITDYLLTAVVSLVQRKWVSDSFRLTLRTNSTTETCFVTLFAGSFLFPVRFPTLKAVWNAAWVSHQLLPIMDHIVFVFYFFYFSVHFAFSLLKYWKLSQSSLTDATCWHLTSSYSAAADSKTCRSEQKYN